VPDAPEKRNPKKENSSGLLGNRDFVMLVREVAAKRGEVSGKVQAPAQKVAI